MNTEEEHALAGYFHIRSIPTLMIFRENIIVYAAAGALSAAALDEVLAGAAGLDLDAVRQEAAQPVGAKAQSD